MAYDAYFGFNLDQRKTLQRLIDEAVTAAVSAVPTATTTTAGVVKKAATQANFAGADTAALVTELNTFLTKLKTAGLVN